MLNSTQVEVKVEFEAELGKMIAPSRMRDKLADCLPLKERIARRNATAVKTTTTTLSRFIKIGDNISHLAVKKSVLSITTVIRSIQCCPSTMFCVVIK